MMKIKPFLLERYFAQHEFSAPYLLSASDCESLSVQELLGWADAAGLALWEALKLGYTESQGHPLLREEIARLYEKITPDDVLVATPEEAIFILMNTLLEPGDHAIVTYPGYQSLYAIAESAGCQVTKWTLQVGEAGWDLDLNFLEDNITERTKLLVVNFPHNPTGYLLPQSGQDAIIELARRHDLYLFSDEMYWLLEHEPAYRLPAMCDQYDKGISLFGLSKSLSAPGLRIGWLATRDKTTLEKFVTFKDYTTICSSAPSEILAIVILQARETIIARNLEIIQHNLQIADAFFAERADRFTWHKPQAGSIAFPRWTDGTSVEKFCGKALREGVMIVPGTVFEFPGDHFRLGLGRRNFPEALEQVQKIVDS